MATKTTLRAEVRSRRRARRAGMPTLKAPFTSEFSRSPIPVRDRAEAEGIAHQIRTLASSMGAVTLPALFVPTPLEPDMSLALGLFEHALLPVLLDEAGAPPDGASAQAHRQGRAPREEEPTQGTLL